MECVAEKGLDFIITRNVKDFSVSKIKVLTSERQEEHKRLDLYMEKQRIGEIK